MALTSITKATTTISAGWTAFNNLISDLASVVSGKGASCIGVEDSSGNLDATTVEGAITEIYSDHATTRALTEVFNEDSDTTTGLTWGYHAGSIRNDNTITSVAAGTLALTDDATNYVECDGDGSITRNTTGFTSGQVPLRQIVVAGGVQSTSTDKRAWFQSVNVSIETVPSGGTGLSTITDHGIMLGSGTSAITVMTALTNGQLAIGSTGADPVGAVLTGTANQVTVTNAAGSITLSIPLKDEDNMISDSATSVASQQSIKAYTDAVDPYNFVNQTPDVDMVFYMAAVPTGWAESSGDNVPNSGLRVVAAGGTGATSGGTHDMQTPPSTAHTHACPIDGYGERQVSSITGALDVGHAGEGTVYLAATGPNTTNQSGPTAFAPKYMDVIVANKAS